MTTTVQHQAEQAPAPAPAAGTTGSGSPASRRVLVAAAALVAAQLGLRAWGLSRGWFHYDDLIFTGRGASFPLFSTDLLLHDRTGT